MYGISVLSCMSSALSEPGGAGLGTLGLPPARAEAMAREAGFTRFRRLPVDHAVNAFYESPPVDFAFVVPDRAGSARIPRRLPARRRLPPRARPAADLGRGALRFARRGVTVRATDAGGRPRSTNRAATRWSEA